MVCELPIGLASVYLVQDQKAGLVQLTNPNIVISERFELEGFADLLVSQKPNGLFDRWISKAASDPSQVHQMRMSLLQTFEDLLGDRRHSFPFAPRILGKPLLVVSQDIESRTLSVLKIMKLRGYLPSVVALGRSAERDAISEAISWLETLLKDKLVFESPTQTIRLFRPPKKLFVVAGLKKTIFSTIQSCDHIVKGHPELSSRVNFQSEALSCTSSSPFKKS